MVISPKTKSDTPLSVPRYFHGRVIGSTSERNINGKYDWDKVRLTQLDILSLVWVKNTHNYSNFSHNTTRYLHSKTDEDLVQHLVLIVHYCH